MIVWMLSMALGSDCIIPAYSTDLTKAVADAEDTFRSLDIDSFKAATDRLDALLPCLADPVPRRVAAQVHRYLGIRSFGDRDPEAARLKLAAGRALEPTYTFPEGLMPAGHPVRALYDGITFDDARFSTAPAPADGYLQFDGRTTNQRPNHWATIVQRFDGTGKIVDTVYLMPADPLPRYPVRVGEQPLVIPYDEPLVEERGPPVALIAATGVAAATTGVLYGMAGAAHSRFMNPNTPDASLDGLASKANTLSIASAISATATAGLGAGVVLRL